MIRIGHKGAAALGPENTLLGIERALAAGVDMVEVDVLPLADGTLVLGHSDDLRELTAGRTRGRVGRCGLAELRRLAPDLATLDEALALLGAGPAGVLLDLKRAGHEEAVVAAVRRYDLVGRTLVSSCLRHALRRVGALEPGIRRGLSYPFDRLGVSGVTVLSPLVAAAFVGARRTLPRRIAGLLAGVGATAAVLHYLVVSAAAVRRCHEAGAAVYAWTVDDPALCRRLAALGVEGVVTNDPRIVGS